MCRLFGFRSVIPSQVHRSLVAADNAMCAQSSKHPDGWGVAYYVDDAPHVMKSPTPAFEDHIFHRVSGVVASETVLAHVRKATVGGKTVLNTHPFQYGRWVFAHNGDIKDFERCRAALREEVAPKLRRFILGETDSEVIFFLFLTHLARHGRSDQRFAVEEVAEVMKSTIRTIRDVCDPGAPAPSILNCLVTNGTTLVASRFRKELFWSSYKTRCGDRDGCPNLQTECEAPSVSGFVNHLIVASEPLSGDNVWIPMEEGEIVGVDWRMRLHRTDLDGRALPTAATAPPPEGRLPVMR